MPTIPEGAKTPQDHKPKAPAKGAKVTVNYKGTDYFVEPDCMDDWEHMEALEGGQNITVIKAVLGPEQYAALRAQLKEEANGGRVSYFDSVAGVMEALMSAPPTDKR